MRKSINGEKQAFKGLGDPKTWSKDARKLKAKFKRRPKRYKISLARILQINNDVAEDMCRASTHELIEVVKYLGDEFDALWQKKQADRDHKLFEKAICALDRFEKASRKVTVRAK